MNKPIIVLLLLYNVSCSKSESPMPTQEVSNEPDTIDLYIEAGQSNQDGRATEFYPYADNGLRVNGVMMWNWKAGGFSVFEYDKNNGGQTISTPKWSGGIVAYRKLYELTKKNIYAFKATLGGSALHPETKAIGNWTIPQDSVPDGNARMFDTLKNRLAFIRTVLSSKGKSLNIRALIWHQGESDRGKHSFAYKERLTKLFGAIRDEIGNNQLPIIMGSIPSHSEQFDEVVNAAHHEIAANDSNIFLISLDGQPMQYGNVHLNATAQQYYGEKIFEIIRQIQGL